MSGVNSGCQNWRRHEVQPASKGCCLRFYNEQGILFPTMSNNKLSGQKHQTCQGETLTYTDIHREQSIKYDLF